MNNVCYSLCLARKIARYRLTQGLSQKDFAEQIGICTSYLGKIESGKSTSRMSLELLQIIASKFNMSLSELLTIDEVDKAAAQVYFDSRDSYYASVLKSKKRKEDRQIVAETKSSYPRKKREETHDHIYDADGFSPNRSHFKSHEDFIKFCRNREKE